MQMTFDPKSTNLTEASLKTLHSSIKVAPNSICIEEIPFFRHLYFRLVVIASSS
jgi:hypothetical protein